MSKAGRTYVKTVMRRIHEFTDDDQLTLLERLDAIRQEAEKFLSIDAAIEGKRRPHFTETFPAGESMPGYFIWRCTCGEVGQAVTHGAAELLAKRHRSGLVRADSTPPNGD